MSDAKPTESKFLGICILLAAVIISGTIVWSTQSTLAVQQPKAVLTPVDATPSSVITVKLDGPVTLAPFTAPIPVTITNTDTNPIVMKQKDAPEKTWIRNP